MAIFIKVPKFLTTSQPLANSSIKCSTLFLHFSFIKLVDQILNITNEPEYQQNQNNQTLVKELEEKINSLFYKMYELTPENIEIIKNA